MDSTNGRPSEREAQRAHASRDELVERIARAVRDDGTADAAGRAAAPPRLRAHGAGARRVRPRLLRDRAGQQGDPAGRPPLPVRPRPLPHRHRRAAHREPDRRGVAGAPLPGPRPHARPRPRRLGHGRGRAPRAAEPVRRDGHRREPAGRGPAGRRRAARPAPGRPGRRALPRAAGHAGDRLPAPDGRAGRPAPAHRGPGRRHPPHRRGHRAAAARLRPAAARSRTWRASSG